MRDRTMLACAGSPERIACSAAAAAVVTTTAEQLDGSVEFKVPDDRRSPASIGAGEGKLNIVAWAGYAEDGSTDKNVDWVTPFEKETGCKVNVKVANTSDEMVTLMRTGRYDGVSASGNASVRLIAGGDVVPIDTKILTNWPNIDPHPQEPAVQLGRRRRCTARRTATGRNLLLYDTKNVDARARQLGASSIRRRRTRARSPSTTTRSRSPTRRCTCRRRSRTSEITNPYELDQKQFDAAVALMKKQRALVGQYWADYVKQQQGFAQGDLDVGTIWQYTANLLEADKQPSRRSCRRRARPAGRTHGCCRRRRSTRTACSSG